MCVYVLLGACYVWCHAGSPGLPAYAGRASRLGLPMFSPLTSGLLALMLRHRPCMGLHGTSSCNGNASGGWRRLSPVFPRVQFVPCKGSTFILYGKIFAIQLVACRFGFLWGLVCKHGEHGRRLSVLIVFQQCQKPVLLPVPFFADLKMSCGLGEFCAAWVCMRKALALRGLQAGRPCVCNGAGL